MRQAVRSRRGRAIGRRRAGLPVLAFRAALALVAVCAGTVAAQSPADAQTPAVAAVITRDIGEGEVQETLAALLARRLRSELERRGYELSPPGPESSGRGEANDPRVTMTVLAGVPDDVDLLVAAFYRLEGEAIVVQFVLIDPVVDIVVGGVLSRRRAGLTISTSVDEAIGDLRPALDRWESDRDLLRRGAPPDKVERIFVSGRQEDVRVRFAELEVGEVRGGRIFVPYSPFPVGTTVPMILSKPGYHERTQDVFLDGPRVEAELPMLYPAATIGLSALWTSSHVRGAGVGLRYYPAADLFYVLGEHYRFVGPPLAPGAVGRAVRTADSRLAAGLYFAAPEAFVRPFGELGGGVIVTDLEASGGLLDDDALYRDVYVGVSIGAEINLGRWKPFARADIDYALGLTGNNLLGNRWYSPPLTALLIPVPMTTIGVQHTW